MELRPYQNEAFEAVGEAYSDGHNPAVVMATGTGKSLVIAEIAFRASRSGGGVLVATHDVRLVEQNAATYLRHTGETPGVLCASLNRKELGRPVTFATIGSVLSSALPEPEIVVIDEAHRIPFNDGTSSQYEKLFASYGMSRRIGFTATPWRMDNGLIYGTEGSWFDTVAYEYSVAQGVADGYLCPLVGVETEEQLDVRDVEVSGDFVQTRVAQLQSFEWLTGVARAVKKLAHLRKHIAVYCPTVIGAIKAKDTLQHETGWPGAVLHSDMPKHEQARVLEDFKSGKTRFLCSVDMLTTGFDFPAMDCIVCLRPTISSSLWVQIQGRLTRLHSGKHNGLVLDFVGNLLRLGGVGMYDTYYRAKSLEQVPAEPREPYRPKERKVYPGTTGLPVLDPMTGDVAETGALIPVDVHNVTAVAISVRNKTYPVLLVTYVLTTREGVRIDGSRFVDTEHPKDDAVQFFTDRRVALQLPCPARNAMWSLKGAYQPVRAVVKKSGRYWNVVSEEFIYDA